MVFGTGTSGIEKFREAIYKLDEGKVKRLGSTVGTVGGEEQGRAGAGINRFNP